jgi:CBS domain-containing protein
MTAPVASVTADTSLADIARQLTAGRFSGLPVVDGDHRVIGLVSEIDLMTALLNGRDGSTPAAELMSAPAISVDEFETTDEVMRIFRERGIHHLPVVRQERLVGIITPSDVVRLLVERLLPAPPEAG